LYIGNAIQNIPVLLHENFKRKNCIVEHNQGSTKPLDCSSMMTEKSRPISEKILNFADSCLEVQVYCNMRGYCCLSPQDR